MVALAMVQTLALVVKMLVTKFSITKRCSALVVPSGRPFFIYSKSVSSFSKNALMLLLSWPDVSAFTISFPF